MKFGFYIAYRNIEGQLLILECTFFWSFFSRLVKVGGYAVKDITQTVLSGIKNLNNSERVLVAKDNLRVKKNIAVAMKELFTLHNLTDRQIEMLCFVRTFSVLILTRKTLAESFNQIDNDKKSSRIDSYIEIGKYEQAFDKIHTSELSYDDVKLYRQKVIPYMKSAHEELRNSSKENLAFVLDETEYYISENKIYSKVEGEAPIILYETSSYDKYLRYRWSIYANDCLFFVEGQESRNYDTWKKSYRYTAKYIDLKTGEVEILGSAESRGDIVKLDNGSIFIGQNILDFNEGIYSNPYTKSSYIGEDAVSDSQLEDMIYMN